MLDLTNPKADEQLQLGHGRASPRWWPCDALMMGLVRPVSMQSVRAKGLRTLSLAKSFENSL